MFEEDSWVGAPDCVFPNKCDKNSVKEVSNLASESSGRLHHCFKRKNMDSTDSEFCQNGSSLDNKKAAGGENSCSFPLGPISLADDDLSFFDNSHVDKDVNDLLYYNWSEIGNFEDIDMMFSCDSTFGLGDGNVDDLGCFSSSDVIGGSREGLRSAFELQNPESNSLENTSARLEVSRTKETCSSVSDSGTKNQPASYNGNLCPSQKDESANLSDLSFVNESSNSECNLVPQNKIHMNSKHANHQNQAEGKRTGAYLENGDALHKIDGLPGERKYSTETTGPKVNLISSGCQQQNEAHEPETNYLTSSFSYMSDYSHSDQTVFHPTSSITKSGINGFMSFWPKDFYTSNHLQPIRCSPDPSLQIASITTSEKKAADKLLHQSGIKFVNNSDLVGISMTLPAELDSSIVLESTSISSRLDEVAEEATGFHQLQCVTERLDTRTKLCIRDSLYRLARNAELRHRDAISDSGENRDRSQALISERTNKEKGYMDMERDTNPIDRSIAHLLFLRSSGSYATPDRDALA